FRGRLSSPRRDTPPSLTYAYPPAQVYVYFLRYNSSLLVFKKCILLLCPKLLHPLQTTQYLLLSSYSQLHCFFQNTLNTFRIACMTLVINTTFQLVLSLFSIINIITFIIK